MSALARPLAIFMAPPSTLPKMDAVVTFRVTITGVMLATPRISLVVLSPGDSNSRGDPRLDPSDGR